MLHRPVRRPLAAIVPLTLVDYVLWNWSIGGGHGVVALIAGLALIPLLIVLAWLLLIATTRIAAEATRRIRAGAAARASAASTAAGGNVRVAAARRRSAAASAQRASDASDREAARTARSSKLAA